MDFIPRLLIFLIGLTIVALTLFSAVRTFVLPRSARDPLTRRIFIIMRKIFNLLTNKVTTYAQRDQIMAMYAPITLLLMPIVWLSLILTGFALMFLAVNPITLYDAFVISGSSLLTLGFAPTYGAPAIALEFVEAAIGLITVALLIAYLPTMYSAFSQREAAVAMMEIRAGSPPSAVTMLERYHRLNRLDELHQVWTEWEVWFVYVEESHTSLAPLVFFRSPQPERSWVTAAGAVLDAAALYDSCLDFARDAQSNLMLRAGYITLRRICDFFLIPYDPDPKPGDPISITREEFDEAYDHLAAEGLPMKADREQAWVDFLGWRVNYDVPLLSLAALTMAPYAPWSSDRSLNPVLTRRWIDRVKKAKHLKSTAPADEISMKSDKQTG